jgi:NAD(P)H-dependent FMN reductase
VTAHRFLLLGGSHARPSHTAALLRAAAAALDARGAVTVVWDVAERPLPAVLRRPPAAFARALAAEARLADALVVATPLYHGSYSGAVKDALDHLSADELAGKPVALLSHSGGFPTTQALDHLRAVVRSMRALAVPEQVVTTNVDYRRERDAYVVASAAIGARLDALAAELTDLTIRLRPAPGRTRRDRPARAVLTGTKSIGIR